MSKKELVWEEAGIVLIRYKGVELWSFDFLATNLGGSRSCHVLRFRCVLG